jgi:hypothetical protein
VANNAISELTLIMLEANSNVIWDHSCFNPFHFFKAKINFYLYNIFKNKSLIHLCKIKFTNTNLS